jgi:ATP phosphoribosyltransferase regulatory subunit
VCEENGVSGAEKTKLLALVRLYGAPEAVLPELKAVFGENACLAELASAAAAAQRGRLQIDFSVPANVKYYNGIVFKGYVKGLPDYVLSGGQYDHLMKRMKKNCRALGFAVYLDALQQLGREEA